MPFIYLTPHPFHSRRRSASTTSCVVQNKRYDVCSYTDMYICTHTQIPSSGLISTTDARGETRNSRSVAAVVRGASIVTVRAGEIDSHCTRYVIKRAIIQTIRHESHVSRAKNTSRSCPPFVLFFLISENFLFFISSEYLVSPNKQFLTVSSLYWNLCGVNYTFLFF